MPIPAVFLLYKTLTASFYAELTVSGHAYPVRYCTYSFTQATDGRGRVIEKVRHGLVLVTLDVPDDEVLLDWANSAYKPLAGHITFFETDQRTARESVSWEVGHCVSYVEDFVSGDQSEGAYVCHLRIASPQLTLHVGGPGNYVPPAPREHGQPVALLNPFLLPTLTPVTVPTADALLEAAALELLATATLPVTLTLALLLGSPIPAGGPGIPQPPLLPIDPNRLRLNELAARHAAGTLSAGEEAELIELLAKVKGIHVKKLSDLRTLPRHLPDLNAGPKGPITRINLKDEAENQQALMRENESAVLLARAGYDVEQNPRLPHTNKNPDYLIEGQVFDCYSPSSSNPRAIWTNVASKVKKQQTQRIILNLDDSGVAIHSLSNQFNQYPISGLQEIIIVKQGQILHFLP